MNRRFDVPRPSRYIKHSTIDSIASEISDHWISESTAAPGALVVDVEDFAASVLEKELHWEAIEEPNNRSCFAGLVGDSIILNCNHEALFKAKPFILRSSIAHEIGHVILRHPEKFASPDQLFLFAEAQVAEIRFHDSAFRRYDYSDEEYLETRRMLAKKAIVDMDARDILASLDDRLEPEWMFYQAEQFASCFLIPKNRLFQVIAEAALDLRVWPSLYKLAEIFGTSISMVCVRLQKLNLISITGRQISLIEQPRQMELQEPRDARH